MNRCFEIYVYNSNVNSIPTLCCKYNKIFVCGTYLKMSDRDRGRVPKRDRTPEAENLPHQRRRFESTNQSNNNHESENNQNQQRYDRRRENDNYRGNNDNRDRGRGGGGGGNDDRGRFNGNQGERRNDNANRDRYNKSKFNTFQL